MSANRPTFLFKTTTAATLLSCLLFTHTAMAATGTVNINTRYQTLEGFGAAGAWYEGWLTDHPSSETLYNLLFDQLGLDIYRVRNTYDYDSGYMSRTQTIVTEALQRNPNLKIMISSWSPPGYLKSNGETVGGDNATLDGGPSNYVYTAFADWWADSISAWSGTYGVDADYISIQNEVDYDATWDSCRFNPTENTSVAGYDEAFEAVYNEMYSRFNSSMPKMLAPETVSYTSAGSYISEFINQSHVYGYAHHLYGPSSGDDPDGYLTTMSSFAATYYGSKPLFQTEYSHNNTTFTDGLNLALLMHNSLTVEGVVSYFYWDLYWASPGGLISFPSYGTDSYTINPVYYAFKHYAKFTDPGWHRIDASENSSDLRMSAYISPNTLQLSVIIINTGGSSVNLDLSFTDYSITSGSIYRSSSSQNCALVGSYSGGSLSIPAQSITTLSIYGTGDTDPPAAPTGLSATGGDGTVWLDWNDNSEGDLAGYNVYRSTTHGSGYSKINGSLVINSNYTDSSVTNGTTYYYVVTAVDNATNESGYSNEDNATPIDVPPAAPTGLVATAGSSTVWLNWNDNSEGDLDGYNVYRSTTQGSGYTQLNGSLVGSSAYTDITVSNGTTYYYVVTAVDMSLHESGYSNVDWATPSGGAPVIYNFEGITQSNTNYNAYACDVDVFPFYDDAENRNSMVEATDQEYVNISADNTAEWTIPTPYVGDELFVWIEMKIDVPPNDISRIDLTFNGNTGSSGSTSHAIHVMKAGADWTANSSWVQVGSGESIPGGVDTAMTRSITSDIGTYIDGTGKIVWGVAETTSNEAMHINYLEAAVYGPPDNPPAAPTGLVVTGGNEIVWLDWDDNSEVDVNGYNVYRSTTQGSGYSRINGSLLSSSGYTDNSVTNGITYYYVVTAVDTASQESGYSNEVSATPNPSTIYTFSGITAENTEYNAYACDVDRFPFAGSSSNRNSMVEATDTQYTYIAADDSTSWTTADPGSSDEILLWVEMKIDEIPASISQIGLTFDGYTAGSSSVTHRIYVLTAGADWTQTASWTQVGTDQSIPSGTFATMTRSITSNFSNYIDGTGKITWAVYETTSSEPMHVNYLEMEVTGTADTTPPAAPTGLVATAGNNVVTLDWDDNSEVDVNGYNVYRSQTSGSGYSQLNVSLVADSNYIDNDVNNGTPYYYVVTAVDTNDHESGYSSEASATPDYQDCNDVQAGGDGLVSDINGDCYVNLLDVEIMADYWLHTDCAGLGDCEKADFEPDGDVDFVDFSDLAVDWMSCNDPQDPACTPTW